MKKSRIRFYFSLICLFLCISLALCGCSSNKSTEVVVGNQTAFLKDMAKGIEDRLSKSNADTSNMSQEKLMDHYEKLVSYELDRIQKYENQVFENDDFDTLAHLYIDACLMQLEATRNYKNDELYSALWDGGRIVRSGLIITLYDRYDLPITAEQAGEYRTTATNVEYSVSGDTDFLDIFGGGKDDIVLSVGDLIVVDTEATFDKGSSSEYDRYEYSFTVKNNSEHDLESFSIQCVVTDLEGNILGTETQWIHNTVASGKSAKLEGAVYLKDYDLPICIVPDKFSYDGNGDSFVYEINADADNAEQFTIKIESTTQSKPVTPQYSSSDYSNSYSCTECGNYATKTYKNPFSGITEYYCNTHYQEILDIIGMMESNVGNSNQSKHTCEQCSKEGTHVYKSFTGQTEYYCTKHYNELMDMLDAFGIG